MASVDRGRACLILLCSLALTVLVSAPASAQQYPPPTPTDPAPTDPAPTATPKKTPKPKCKTPGTAGGRGSDGSFRAQTEFKRGETVAMRGGKGCVKPNQRVDLLFGTGRSQKRIGSSMSTQNGAYMVSGRIPPRTPYGKHKIFAAPASGRAYGATIEVVPAGGSRRSAVVGSLVAAWVALAGIVAGFVFSSRRRRRPVAAVAAGAESQVPLLDTWDFQPVLPGRRSRRTSPSRRGTGAKPPGATKKTKPKAAKPKASETSGKASRASKPKGSTAKARTPKKASPTARRGGTLGGTRAPKKTAPKSEPKRKPPKD